MLTLRKVNQGIGCTKQASRTMRRTLLSQPRGESGFRPYSDLEAQGFSRAAYPLRHPLARHDDDLLSSMKC